MWNESNISAHFPENMCLHHKICHHKLALIGSLSKVAKEWMGPGYRTNIFPLQVVFSSRNWDVHCLGKVKFVLLVHVLLIHRRFQCTASVFIGVAFTLLKKINKNLKLYLKKKKRPKKIYNNPNETNSSCPYFPPLCPLKILSMFKGTTKSFQFSSACIDETAPSDLIPNQIRMPAAFIRALTLQTSFT